MSKNKTLTINESFNLAVKNHQEGKIDVAQELYNQVLKIDPNYAKAHNNLGTIFQKLNDLQKAKNCYEKAIEIDPNYTNAYYNLGVIFLKLSDLQKAKECFEKAIKIDPNYTDAYNSLGNILKEFKEHQKAKECFEKAIEINPNYTDAHNNLGVLFKELGEFEKAKKCFEKAIEINPSYAKAHNNLGVILRELEEFEKAKSCYEKAIEINPNYADAYYNLGVIFLKLSDLQKAKECFEKAIEINPDYTDANNQLLKSLYQILTIDKVFNLAVKNHQEGKIDIAQKLYNQVLKIDPNYAKAHNNLGVIFEKLEDHNKAKNCYEKAIEIDPNSANTHNNLGAILQELGEKQKAKDCYEKAIEIDPNYANSYYNLGTIFQDLGEKQKAKECYEKAIEIDPDYTNANNQLLKSLYQINNQSILFKKLESITKEGKMNAVIGSIFSRSKVKYGFKKNNPFCNDPLDYVLKINLIEKYDFKNVIVDCVHNILKDNSLSNRPQSLIENGYQTSGNLFANKDFNTKEIQRIIYAEIDKYRLKFKDSKEGFINNWPTNYNLKGWLISMKNGGKLKAHMHDIGWLSGSIYVNVPPKLQTDSGNLVVCIDENENEKSIDVITGSLCLFPSSLLHYTIPFESEEERIVLAFDMLPN